jgi:hypothetical protein
MLMNDFRKSKRAITPAIAVALLLGITVALVAAVGYSATSATPDILQSNKKGTFDVTIRKTGGAMATGDIIIREISGDSIPTSDLQIQCVAKGVTTTLKPVGNNTMFWRWMLFNPTDDSPDIPFDPEGIDEFSDNKVRVGVQFTNAQSEYDNPPTANWVNTNLDVTGYGTYYSGGHASSSGTKTFQFENVSTYVDPWHGADSEFAMFVWSDKTGRNFNFSWIQIKDKSSGVTVQIDLTPYVYQGPEYGTMGQMDCNDAVYVRMQEYGTPYLYTGKDPTWDNKLSYGAFTLTSGSSMKVTAVSNGVGGFQTMLSNWNDINVGDSVEMYITYIPSKQVIWQGEVIVQ